MNAIWNEPPSNKFKPAKKIAPAMIEIPAKKNGGYLSIKYFVVITQISVRIIAINSKKFPNNGFGAISDLSESTLNNTEPTIEMNRPKYTIRTNRSFSIILAPITNKTGSNELTIPA